MTIGSQTLFSPFGIRGRTKMFARDDDKMIGQKLEIPFQVPECLSGRIN